MITIVKLCNEVRAMKRSTKILMALTLASWGVLFAGCKKNESENPSSFATGGSNSQPATPSNFGPPSPNPQPNPDDSEAKVPAYAADTIFFIGADVSLVPDAQWQQLNTGPFTECQSICMPVLEGIGTNHGCLIQVFTTEGNAEVKRAAEALEKDIESHANTIKGTFRKENFNPIKEIQGVQISYAYQAHGPLGVNELRAHVYLLQNKKKNCIVINFITFADRDSQVVRQRILNSLQLN